MPEDDARSLLLALCAVESVRGELGERTLDVHARNERRSNGAFEADNFRFVRRS
jgi:hypothetical protein